LPAETSIMELEKLNMNAVLGHTAQKSKLPSKLLEIFYKISVCSVPYILRSFTLLYVSMCKFELLGISLISSFRLSTETLERFSFPVSGDFLERIGDSLTAWFILCLVISSSDL
jgi:hypothetical protein